MTGPIPPSFAALSNLESLVLSFNNFDGPTPEYIASLPINDEGDISTNCFETQGVPLPVATALDNKFPGWTSQYNCRANIVLEGQLEAQLTPGSCTNYQITYENIGPQVAKNVKIGQLFGPQITVQSSIPSYAT